MIIDRDYLCKYTGCNNEQGNKNTDMFANIETLFQTIKSS